MRRLALTTAMALICGQALANEIDISVDNFSQSGGIVSAVLKLTNNLDQPVTQVFVDCAFLREDKRAIDIGKEIVSQIDAKSYAYGKAAIVTDQKVRYADCRVTSYK